MLFIDGHTSHVTKDFIEIAAKHSVYVVVEPSHTSILLQVADLGINIFIKEQFGKEYNASFLYCNVNSKSFDDVERIACVVRTVAVLKKEPDRISKFFEKAGLSKCYSELNNHFDASEFKDGISLRDSCLPKVTNTYIAEVFSLQNLAASIGSPIVIPTSLIDGQNQRLTDYKKLNGNFFSFYFALGATVERESDDTNKEEINNTQNTSGGNISNEIVHSGLRKLFKLGKATNVPRGAQGRVTTAYGSL